MHRALTFHCAAEIYLVAFDFNLRDSNGAGMCALWSFPVAAHATVSFVRGDDLDGSRGELN